jgi:hypothetical protein
MRRLKESGQVMVVTVLSMSLLIGFLALAVDVGTLFRAKRLMQTAADSAAIAGAQEYLYGDMTAAADAAAAQNGVPIGGANGGVVTVNNGPLSGPHQGQSGYIEAIVSQTQPTFFGKIFTGSIFQNSVAVTARAVATLGPSQSCIYTLGSGGITLVGNSSITVTTCGIEDNGNLSLTHNASVTASSIGVVGTYSGSGATPTPVVGIAPVSDPLAYLTAPPYNPPPCVSYSGAATLTPGCYNGISLAGNKSLTLSAGTYVINGDFNVAGNANLTGIGVTFEVLGSTSLAGNGTINITAPTSPTTNPYLGILFYQPATNTSSLSLVGNAGSTLEGVIYAPTAAVSLNGNAGSTIYTDYVVSSLSLNGNASLLSYGALAGTSTPLLSARLVE